MVCSGTVRGTAGFFRVGQQASGYWTLIDPEGAPFFARGVHEVSNPTASLDGALEPPASAALRRWGFNCAGVGGDGSTKLDGMPFVAAVEYAREGVPILLGPGLRLPDVYDVDWPRLAAHTANVACGALTDERALIGWFTDSGLSWPHVEINRHPGLLQQCLSLEPSRAAYHAAWEFVTALHPGGLEAVARAWSVPLANKEVVRELTRSETPIPGRGYARDDARWTGEFARRYITIATEAIRAADPHHLVLGPRLAGPVGGAVLAGLNYPNVDVAVPHWSELPSIASAARPVLAGELCWSADPGWQAMSVEDRGPSRRSRLTSVERMLRRGRATLRRLARHPSVVGYFWTRWCDYPGEVPPFARGLVHVDGREAREHTELLNEFNLRADAIRRAATKTRLR